MTRRSWYLMYYLHTCSVFLIMVLQIGCDSFVEGVEDPIEVVSDESLNNESQISLVVNAVKTEFAFAYGNLATRAGLLSDELKINPASADPGGPGIDDGTISLDNSQTIRLHRFMGEFRAAADDLIRRADVIEFTDGEKEREVRFTGYFYKGIARYFIASFGGREKHEGGGVITTNPANPGKFLSSSELYDQALAELESARVYALEADGRTIATIAARIHLIKGDYSAAREEALGGLTQQDESFATKQDNAWRNIFYNWSSPVKQNGVFDPIYKAFADSDPGEQIRIPLASKMLSDSTVIYFQDRYNHGSDPLPFATWRENELILAEVDLRDGDSGSALSRVNEVRVYWGIAPLESIDLGVLEKERRKELWGTGLRLIDQRRFPGSWHLGPDTWQYFPIPRSERDINPNL